MGYLFDVLGVLAGTGVFLTVWYQYWLRHARRYDESGYTPPPTSLMGEIIFHVFTRVYGFVVVGPVKTLRGTLTRDQDGHFVFRHEPHNEEGRLIFTPNHQVPADFAMLRHVTGRHFRALTSANELAGGTPFSVGSAATGVISVGFKNKDDGAKAQAASIKAMSADYFRIEKSLALTLLAGSFIVGIGALLAGYQIVAGLAALVFLAAACTPSSEQGFAIFPAGTLLPDDPQFEENFRPGGVRIDEAVAVIHGDAKVKMVPLAIFYERDKKKAHWSQRFFHKARSSFHTLRRPVNNAAYQAKVDPETLSADERAALLAKREELTAAYKKSRRPTYGAVVVRGNAISRSELPDDDFAAMDELKARVKALYEVAQRV